jgi:hypothetical protein
MSSGGRIATKKRSGTLSAHNSQLSLTELGHAGGDREGNQASTGVVALSHLSTGPLPPLSTDTTTTDLLKIADAIHEIVKP